jgi:hypothetical protein
MTIINKIKTRTSLRSDSNNSKFFVETVYVIEDSHISASNLINSVLQDKDYTPVKGDKIYIYPGSTIPRFKVKTFCETYKVALVKYPDKANVKIIGENYGKDILKHFYHSCYVRTELLDHLYKYGNTNNDFIKQAIESLENQTSELVHHDYHINRILTTNFSIKILSKAFVEKELDDATDSYYDEIGGAYIKDEDAYKKLVEIINDPNIYPETTLLKKLNTGGIMDAVQYESIKRLFESSDTSNCTLAMEAIANCDFERSAVYLLLLVHEYHDKMYDSPNRNHVNFKSFMKFFNVANLRYHYSYDNLIDALLKRNLLNQTNLDVLRPLLTEEAESRLSGDYYTIDKLIWSDKIVEGLRNNILDVNFNTELYEEPEEELQIKGLNINEKIFDVI